jgi:hypothetical protein
MHTYTTLFQETVQNKGDLKEILLVINNSCCVHLTNICRNYPNSKLQHNSSVLG